VSWVLRLVGRGAGQGARQWGVSLPQSLSAHARSFGAAAAAYERGRPSYPQEALDWLVPAQARRVLDLGAGTGKLTRQLVRRGLDVIAVEPSARMREQLALVLPEVRTLPGTAERIPLEDAAVDAVLVAQAWHWMDPASAVPEVARVLTPSGQLGLLWNVRDERVPWVADLGGLLRQGAAPAGEPDLTDSSEHVGAPFSPPERRIFTWVHQTTPTGVLDLVASRSYVITLSDGPRARLLSDVRALVSSHPALVGKDTIELPYQTRCTRTGLP